MDLEPLARVLADELARRPPIMAPEYLTAEQAAQFSGFNVRALEALRYRGEGPPFCKVCKTSIRYPVADLRAWLEAGRVAMNEGKYRK